MSVSSPRRRHDVVAGTAVQHVVAQVAGQRVVARAAREVLDVAADEIALAARAVVGQRRSRLALTAALRSS